MTGKGDSADYVREKPAIGKLVSRVQKNSIARHVVFRWKLCYNTHGGKQKNDREEGRRWT